MSEHPIVRGFCPACRRGGLMVGDEGHITCTHFDCPNPSAADELLRDVLRSQRDSLMESGRRLASEREDLIAMGVDPAELEVPLAPVASGNEPAAEADPDVVLAPVTAEDTVRRDPFEHQEDCPDQATGRLTDACNCGQREAVDLLLTAARMSQEEVERRSEQEYFWADPVDGEAELRERVTALIVLHWGTRSALADAVMAVVQPLLAERDELEVRRWVERHRDEFVPRADVDVREKQWRTYEASLNADRDAVEGVAAAACDDRDVAVERAGRAEADLAAAERRIDQVRALHFTRDRWCVCCGFDWPCATFRILNAASADETGESNDA